MDVNIFTGEMTFNRHRQRRASLRESSRELHRERFPAEGLRPAGKVSLNETKGYFRRGNIFDEGAREKRTLRGVHS